ncbi:MAG: hypothetical protein GY699_15055 [Desulfobacteraceae bacterium]|nr:hypothetical protein [Desulfobacteraceae bacterium]
MKLILTLAVIFTALYLMDRVLFLDMTRLGWRKARNSMPGIANRFNLTFVPAKQHHQMGKIQGAYDHYNVSIEPDNNATIRIEIPGLETVRLSTTKKARLLKFEGMKSFEFKNPFFDRIFSLKLIENNTKLSSMTSSESLVSIEQFYNQWKSKIRYIKLSNGVLACSLKYGQATFIPESAVNELLPGLAALSTAVNSMFKVSLIKE